LDGYDASIRQECVWQGHIAVFGEVCLEALVGKDAGLLQAMHALSNLDIHPSILVQVTQGVLVNDFGGHDLQRDVHVLVAGHGGVVVKFLDV
jgi:hypothetical protein